MTDRDPLERLIGIVGMRNSIEEGARAIAIGSDCVVFPAEMVAAAFRQIAGEPRGSVHIHPQGLYAHIRVDATCKAEVRSALGLPADARIALGLGYGDLRKGLDLFIQAAVLANRGDDQLFFVWVGHLDSSLATWLLGRATPENFRHVDFTSDVGRYLNAADVFFLSSREDPFPSTVLEALASGLDAVGFAGCSGTEDLISEYGRLVPALNVQAAADALRELAIATPAASDRGARRTRIAQQFRYDRYAFALLKLLNPDWRAISVVVPNYNYSRYLEARIETILAQTVPVFEIVVLDDASTDDSVAVLQRVAEKSGRELSIIAQQENSGSAIAQWAKGVRHAEGELVWIAEADDLSKPDFLHQLVSAMEARTTFAFSNSAQIDQNGVELTGTYQDYYASAGLRGLTADLCMDAASFGREFLSVRNAVLNVSAVIGNRQVFAEVLDKHLQELQSYSFAGDWHFYILLCQRPGNVAYIARPLNSHRRHEASATHTATAEQHIREVQRVHEFIGRIFGSEHGEQRAHYIDELRVQFGLKERPASTYAEFWDNYVGRTAAQLKGPQSANSHILWPGDEWGTPDYWRMVFSQMFLRYLPADITMAIEIGPGSGKYTTLFLDAFPAAQVIAVDVSRSYLAILQERCADLIANGRLHAELIDNDPQALQTIALKWGIGAGQLDVLYSIDAMVHVDLQYLSAYWLSAKLLLRPGGRLIMTVADPTRDLGFKKLVADIPRLFSKQGEQTDKFEWLCPQLVESVLDRMGFDIEDAIPDARRDYCFVATRR